MPFRTTHPLPQVQNALGQMQDKYLQTPYIVHNPSGSFYNERGYTPGNMQNMVSQNLGEYYGGQTQLPAVSVQPPSPSPGQGYQWNQLNNIWQDTRKSGSYRPGATGNYWGQRYTGRNMLGGGGINMRSAMQSMRGMNPSDQQRLMAVIRHLQGQE